MKRKVLAVLLVLVVAVTAITVLGQGKRRPEQAKDPVCGIMVDKDPNLSYSYKGEAFYFCSKADMEKFRKEPEVYLKKR